MLYTKARRPESVTSPRSPDTDFASPILPRSLAGKVSLQPFDWQVPPHFNIAEAICDKWADKNPDRLALSDIPATSAGFGTPDNWSFGRLAKTSNELSHLFASQGITKGDRIAVLLPQSPAVILMHIAAARLGAILVPLFVLFGPDALSFRLSDSGARLIVTDADNLDKIASILGDLPALKHIWCVNETSHPELDVRNFWDDISLQKPAKMMRNNSSADDPAIMIYTSGTTGTPKGALHAHRILLGHLPSIECGYDSFPQRGDKGWTPADWAWIGGMMDLALPFLYFGVPLVSCAMRKFNPSAAWELIASQNIRNIFLPPTALKLMRAAPVPETVSVRSIISGGEALGEELLEWGRTALGVTINEIYGQTECNLVIGSCRSLAPTPVLKMGCAIPGHKIDIIDENGQPVARGTIGQIGVKFPHPVMFLGYWNQPEQTNAKFKNGYLRTGDLGVCDEEGHYQFVSRDDDIINSSGYRVGPTEIENCLIGHPLVLMAAVIGVPDQDRTEAIKAVIVLQDKTLSIAEKETLKETLIMQVKHRLSPHLAPRLIEWRDTLPLTATGKIMRRSLRDQHINGTFN